MHKNNSCFYYIKFITEKYLQIYKTITIYIYLQAYLQKVQAHNINIFIKWQAKKAWVDCIVHVD